MAPRWWGNLVIWWAACFVGSLGSVTALAFSVSGSVCVLASRLGILTLRSSPCVAPLRLHPAAALCDKY
ncbi:hypothetical protein [Salmonella phage PT1]|nr:hypothetical protein [Salmonella phage PT1]